MKTGKGLQLRNVEPSNGVIYKAVIDEMFAKMMLRLREVTW